MVTFLKPFLPFFVLLCACSISKAQFTKSIPLQPIYKEGSKYFYGTKKVNSAYALQIPLEGIDNREVDRYLKSYKTFQNLRGVAYLSFLIYVFTDLNNPQANLETFDYLFLGGVLVCDITFNAISQSRMRKAIDIYNIAIAPRGSLNLQMERVRSNQTLISFGFRQRF